MILTERTWRHAETDDDLIACHPVMHELRPMVQTPQAFLERVRAQRPQGWHLLAEWQGAEPVALAGYRFMDNLVHGRFLYVDDLVTAATARGGGAGARLLAEIERIARARGCGKLVLDSEAIAHAWTEAWCGRSQALAA
ncbi:GNAT family N-acetyltransferase [Variovorax ginsengisoli]|uniref:GNAT superfamily N-acetyltransferase n=1 Tax=Variovorax ginsengisoli TaxID=363844 RepID=A0ABT9S4N9_9BURK|nr:GNAT family N-acetyltransferase [Variovorax ginsengisoli]MDP9899323.1 GNAT superfamily N-acetyltransferase [Variovorax ginsengisoli]